MMKLNEYIVRNAFHAKSDTSKVEGPSKCIDGAISQQRIKNRRLGGFFVVVVVEYER